MLRKKKHCSVVQGLKVYLGIRCSEISIASFWFLHELLTRDSLVLTKYETGQSHLSSKSIFFFFLNLNFVSFHGEISRGERITLSCLTRLMSMHDPCFLIWPQNLYLVCFTEKRKKSAFIPTGDTISFLYWYDMDSIFIQKKKKKKPLKKIKYLDIKKYVKVLLMDE